ncbi:AGC/AKT protein kinase Sck1 [Schizosaccharomyces cryophilus OY26]|uniref:non-specific serine/threonine protein kinase n=1 Tax=Schizosaccharomyces cryophilus (strain OY26 / ATCC MYA-4695 / CBS 11777 / NBRC 106824 / NRRL Y48691) TaxID=653667 RepID=S9XDN7_SCHCR|nr:AGC/AKT protein kinase Sck1 [Schizosaccharomyces cryophilus OY26]EPY51866.1 AGC/AKT protein kinase Sck1 [Schizosaccharomyces cryophilus OY26]
MTEIFEKIHRGSNSDSQNQYPSSSSDPSFKISLSSTPSVSVETAEAKGTTEYENQNVSAGYDPVLLPDRLKNVYEEITTQVKQTEKTKDSEEQPDHSRKNTTEATASTSADIKSEHLEPQIDTLKTPPSKHCQLNRIVHEQHEPMTSNQILGRLVVRLRQGRNLLISNMHAEPYAVINYDRTEVVTPSPKKVSENGMGISIPSKSRPVNETFPVSPSLVQSELMFAEARAPRWDFETVFDVINPESAISVSVYDRMNDDMFLGSVKVVPVLLNEYLNENWYKLEPFDLSQPFEGEINVQTIFEQSKITRYGPEDFSVLRLIGRGTFGHVYLVRKKDTNRIYAMKKISKKLIVKKKEVTHTIGERNILVRTSLHESPFIVGLKFSFQTASDLYLITDYMSGGELFWHLQHEGRFREDRAKFYIAELVLALEHLHKHDIIYRDLKPENILLDASGHIALCDFGLSKANLSSEDTTNTFCGTTEYLAPEILLDDKGYTKQVDFWSLGVLVFEMCCGWSPFYAPDVQQMYRNIAFGKVRFPKGVLSHEARSFVRGLLNRNPRHRIGATADAEELKAHPFFDDINWTLLEKKKLPPPFKPHVQSDLDVSNFDQEFTNTNVRNVNLDSSHDSVNGSTPLSNTIQDRFKGFTFTDKSLEERFEDVNIGEFHENDRPKVNDSVSNEKNRFDKDDPVADSVFGETFEG